MEPKPIEEIFDFVNAPRMVKDNLEPYIQASKVRNLFVTFLVSQLQHQVDARTHASKFIEEVQNDGRMFRTFQSTWPFICGVYDHRDGIISLANRRIQDLGILLNSFKAETSLHFELGTLLSDAQRIIEEKNDSNP